jgi:hypothetical protein
VNWRPVLFVFPVTIRAITALQDSGLLLAFDHEAACVYIHFIALIFQIEALYRVSTLEGLEAQAHSTARIIREGCPSVNDAVNNMKEFHPGSRKDDARQS